jgi:alpha-1,2-mannosyltransferase
MNQTRPARRLLDHLRHAAWLNHDRVVGWGVVLLVETALIMLFLVLWSHGVVMHLSRPTSSDFVSFYAAGKLALAGTPALAYDHAAHLLAEQQTGLAAGAVYQHFFYPPVYLLLCAPLALLPYYLAYGVFEALTLALFALVMRAVLRERGIGWLAPLLAFPAVWWTLGEGQNSFLTAALLGFFTLLIDTRPVRAGLLLGALCYKPHFGLLAPVALLAGRRWAALASATAAVAVLVGASVLAFGGASWQAYLLALADSRQVYESGQIEFSGFITPFGAARLLGWAPATAYALQGVCAVLMAVLVAVVWRGRASLAQRAAILLVATLLAIPLALIYDQLVALLAIGWLLREAREAGFLAWEKLVLLTVYPLSLLTVLAGMAQHWPFGPLVSLVVLALCIRRIWRSAFLIGRGASH